jgi:hypothetical protein
MIASCSCLCTKPDKRYKAELQTSPPELTAAAKAFPASAIFPDISRIYCNASALA